MSPTKFTVAPQRIRARLERTLERTRMLESELRFFKSNSDPLEVPRLGMVFAGSYRLQQVIGMGSSAAVYHAESSGGEHVALKLLHPYLHRNWDALLAFVRESICLAEMDHPNIAKGLRDAEFWAGWIFFKMEYGNGPSLNDVLSAKSFIPWKRALKLLRLLCDALDAMHSAGLVHRDLSSGNILSPGFSDADLRMANAYPSTVKLCDFGIVLDGFPQVPECMHGSPAYSAPEQALVGASIDQRTDIYSLGVVAYEMLSGQWPFRCTTMENMVIAHRNELPMSLRRSRPELRIPAHVDDAVLKALSKDPDDRFQSAREFGDALVTRA